MSKDISLNNLKSLQPQLKRAAKILVKHALFIVILIILLVYVVVVLQINQLANAEPADDAETIALSKNTIPRVDKTAIQQIQSLEKNNTQVQSLFENARNNPFQE